jgi:hypothetical protein
MGPQIARRRRRRRLRVNLKRFQQQPNYGNTVKSSLIQDTLDAHCLSMQDLLLKCYYEVTTSLLVFLFSPPFYMLALALRVWPALITKSLKNIRAFSGFVWIKFSAIDPNF